MQIKKNRQAKAIHDYELQKKRNLFLYLYKENTTDKIKKQNFKFKFYELKSPTRSGAF